MSNKVYKTFTYNKDNSGTGLLELRDYYMSDLKKFGVTMAYLWTSDYPEKRFVEIPDHFQNMVDISKEEAEKLIIQFQLES